MQITRRTFLKAAGATTAAVALSDKLALAQLKPVIEIGNPLEGKAYPNRSWEDVYRDQYAYDRSFTYICSPNDTHECRVRAFVRNGVVMRIEQNYDHQKIKDVYGQHGPTAAHNPRMCLRGMTFPRRVYGPYRVKYPMMRKGWKQWADDGFPYLNKDLRAKYGFYSRGTDEFVRVSWDQVIDYMTRGTINIAKTYSGDEGARRLLEEGYQKEMVEAMKGAGTRTMKIRGGMALLGVAGKMGLYRVANMLAILDSIVRGVGPDKALGGRKWSNYTWHGDQAPGHPWVHGLQTSDIDLADIRYGKLTIQVGKNIIEQKMADAHWLREMIERGGKTVVIAPEYNPPAHQCDYWIPIRAGLSDMSIFLACAKIIMDEKLVDWDYVKKFTDFPILLRTDTLKFLKPQDIIPDYKMEELKDKTTAISKEDREKVGDFVVWDSKTNKPAPITRDDVGDKMVEKGIDPVLEGTFAVKTVDGKSIIVMPVYEAYKV
ncbi:MAG: twin-arginine translocation signal domain-containing protein, partial [Nitrospirota bacterium]